MNTSMRKLWKSLLILSIVLLISVAYAPAKAANAGTGNVIFVDVDSGAQSRGQSGKSWKKAYNNLQDALDDAAAKPNNPMEIWVADGAYTPSQIYSPEDAGGTPVVGGQFAIDVAAGAIWPEFTVPSTGDSFRLRDDLGTSLTSDELDQLRTFDLPDDVLIYGGFQGQSGPGGGETALTDRPADLTTFRTILSGDIAGDDIAGEPETNKDDNVYHVVQAGNDVQGIGVTVLLNGLTIEGGYADGPRARISASSITPSTTGPVAWEHEAGGGVHNGVFSHMTLDRVVIRENAARANGGGMRTLFDQSTGSAGTTELTVTDSLFKNNTAGVGGYFFGTAGAISLGCFSAGDGHVVKISGSYFEDNFGHVLGGALVFSNSRARNTPVRVSIDSSTFTGNSAERGGVIFANIDTIRSGIGPNTISDSIFFNNSAETGGAILVARELLLITGSIFDQNRAEGGPNTGLEDFRLLGTASNPRTTIIRPQGGGAILIQRGKVAVERSIFRNNVAVVGKGGAIENFTDARARLGDSDPNASLLSGNVSFSVEDSLFENNSAALNGGAISSDVPTLAEVQAVEPTIASISSGAATATITGSTFIGNSAGGVGGAIHNDTDSTTTELSASLFTGNTSGGDGGAIYNAGELMEVTGTGFFDNDAMPDRSNAIFNGKDATLDQDLDDDVTNIFGPAQNIFQE